MRQCFFFLFIFLPGVSGTALYAQYDQVWTFGKNAGLSFRTQPPSAIKTSMPGACNGEANASVCDANGKLLFYTDGTIVWRGDGSIMDNGANLLPIQTVIPIPNCTPTASSCQGALIIPQPGSETRYYIFSITSSEQMASNTYGRLYYSVVDFSLNNGLGAVDSIEKGMLLDSTLKEQMTSTPGNRCNIWLLVRNSRNEFRAFSVSATGVDRVPIKSQIGTLGMGLGSTGQMVVSPDGRKIVTCYMSFNTPTGALDLFDFDYRTGIVSNQVALDAKTDNPYYGAAFSPDNSKLYTFGGFANYKIHQFDITAADPSTTKTLIEERLPFSQLKLGPDGKIYGKYNDSTLAAINFPNRSGIACQFIPDAVPLFPGTLMINGLPNVIHYIPKTEPLYSSRQQEAPCWFNGLLGQTLYPAVPEGRDYYWDNGTSGYSRMAFGPGRYWVQYYTWPCQFHVDTIVLTTPGGVLPHINIDTSCFNAPTGIARAATVPGDTVRYHYTWSNQAGDILSLADSLTGVPAGRYILGVRTAKCDTVLSFEIPELKDRVAFTLDTLVCVQDTILLQNISAGYYQAYTWYAEDRPIAHTWNTSYTATPAGTHEIYLVGQGAVCSDTARRYVTVDERIEVRFSLSDEHICPGQKVHLNIFGANASVVSYVWTFNEEQYRHAIAENALSRAFDKSGAFRIGLRTGFRACPDFMAFDSLFVEALPVVDLGPDSFLCFKGSPIILENKYQLLPFHQEWNTGATTPRIIVTDPGKYRLTAYTALGCTQTEEIEIRKDCYIDIPNCFTPNGDGHNDFFFPRSLLSKGPNDIHMQIFNRWGQLLFETRSIDGRGWDGKWNGRDQPADTYVYRITFQTGVTQEHYNGNISLLR